jgi:putative flippase GtrA
MALAQNRLVAGMWGRLRSKVGVRFTRFVGVAVASLGATEIALTICNGVLEMTSTWAAIISWFCGAVVSYVLSRWAWERKGKPDLLRETVPFWIISAVVLVLLTLANKLGYRSASWMGLGPHGVQHVLWVDFVWLVANFVTFVTRFVIFHYVLFTDRTKPGRTQPGRTQPATAEKATSGDDAPAPRFPAPRA